MINKLIFTICFFVSSVMIAQEDPIVPTVEYATVYAKIYYQGNLIQTDTKGASKSPVLTMPDGTTNILKDYSDIDNPKNLNNFGEIINYMAKYRWEYISSESLPYLGGNGNNSKSLLVNTNEYFMNFVFKRKVQ